MRAFSLIWAGQLFSMLGSAMSWFAFTIWAWQETGKATPLALVGFFSFGPTLLLSPVAGALVDRWDRKLVLVLSDSATGLGTLLVLLLYATDSLEIWHIYAIGAVTGAFWAFQFPAYSAAVTMMLPKEQYSRAEAMIGLAQAASGVMAPSLAAFLLARIGFTGIMLIDITTLMLALGTLLVVSIPPPPSTEAGREGQGSIWRESVYGFRYIFQRPSLFALESLFAAGNFFESLGFSLMAPMILARTADNEMILGNVQSAGAIGGVVGGALVIYWGGPKRKIHGVLLGWALANLLGMSLMGLGAGLAVWAVASFFADLFTPVVDSSDQAIWQAKVAPDVQGRVFATRLLLSQMTIPIAQLLAGPLADDVFEPAMLPGGGLAEGLGWLVGTGPGAGMALILLLAGLAGVSINLGGYAFRTLRHLEDILPDYDGAVAASAEAHA